MTKDPIFAVFVGAATAFLLGVLFGWIVAEAKWKGQAIQHGAAQYNPTNGVFEWKEVQR